MQQSAGLQLICWHMARNVGPPSFRKVSRIQPKAAPYPSDWREQSKAFIEKAGRRCTKCNHTGSMDNPLQTDHIITKANKGKDIPANYRVLCRDCNMARNKVGKPARKR